MNDKQRYQFAGEPQRCILCGAELKHSYYKRLGLIIWICPNYGKSHRAPYAGVFTGTGAQHEHYRFLDSDPGLPELWRPLRVGHMGPTGRSVLYTTIIFLGLFAVVALLASLLGG